MLRVLVLVDHARGITGPHRNVVGSLNALSKREDVQLRLLCGEIDEQEPYARSPGIDIRLGYAPRDPKRVVGNIRRVLSAARGCDVIYVPSGLKSLLYAQMARPGRRLVVGPNVTPLPNWKQDSPGQIDLKLLCDCWLEASEARRTHVFRSTGDAAIKVVHHAIDTEKWGPHRRNPGVWARFGVPVEGLKVLFVSRHDEPLKGVVQLLDAFDLVRQRARDTIQLVLVGGMSEPTVARVSRLGSAYALGFVGPELLPEIYAAADISVVPSSWESFSFTTLESLASGVATVASNAGGMAEQIVDGESGRLVDLTGDACMYRPDAPQRLAAAILNLAEDPDLRAQLGIGARNRVLARFTEARLGQDLVDVFEGRRRQSGKQEDAKRAQAARG